MTTRRRQPARSSTRPANARRDGFELDESPEGGDNRPDLDNDNDEEPLIGQQGETVTDDLAATPPPGVDVTHTHTARWRTETPPPAPANATQFAGMSVAGEDAFLDFIEDLSDPAERYVLFVIRESDPFARRSPGASFNRPCTVRERLGYIPFSAETLLTDIQSFNGNSGGDFTLIAFEENTRQQVTIFRGVIADPPRAAPQALATTNNGAQPKTLIEELQQMALMRTLLVNAGLAVPGDANANAAIDPQTLLAKTLITDSGMMGNVFGALTKTLTDTLSHAQTAANPSTTDKLLDAIISSPNLQDRLGSTIDRLIDRIAGPRDDTGEIDYTGDPNPSTENNDTMNNNETQPPIANTHKIVIEYLMNKCAANEPITIDDPIFAAYKSDMPDAAEMLTNALKLMPIPLLKKTINGYATRFGIGATVGIVLNRPEADIWLQGLKDSAKAAG